MMSFSVKLRDIPDFCSRYRNILFAIILGIGAIFRVAYYCFDDTITRDGVFYLDGVEAWQKVKEFEKISSELVAPENTTAMKYYTAPFYLFLLKILKSCFPTVELEMLAVTWGIVAGIAVVGMTVLIAKKIFNDDFTALLAGFLISIHPRVAESAPLVLRDTTYLFLCGLVMWFALGAYLQRQKWAALCAGIFCFAGISCRIEFSELVLALTVLAIWDVFWTKHKDSYIIWSCFLAGGMLGYIGWTFVMEIPWDFLLQYMRHFIG